MGSWPSARAGTAALLVCAGCRARAADIDHAPIASHASPAVSPFVAPASSSNAPPALAPSMASFEALAVHGFGDAIVSVPSLASAVSPRPVVVATHGHGERPEHPCDVWRALVGDRAFVVCPRGAPVPGTDGFTFVGEIQVADEVDAVLASAHARYGARIAPGPIVFAGFSLGATMAVSMIARDPKRFSRVVLTEGGVMDWTGDRMARFVRGGGERVLFGCGRTSRESVTRWIADTLTNAGAHVKIAFSDAGHTDEGAMSSAIAEDLDWLLGDDPRWRAR